MGFLRIVLVMVVGAFTGLLGGLFGKGGSAIATPLLHFVGVPSFAAVASPLPATIPSTLIAAWAYHRAGCIDRGVLRTTVVVGAPATVIGALATKWVGGVALITVTDLVVTLLGARILMLHRAGGHARPDVPEPDDIAVPALAGGDLRPGAGRRQVPAQSTRAEAGSGPPRAVVIAVAVAVGLASGLLGNSGGFLLAPAFATVLGLPLKRALGTSLAAAAALAVPGTVVHAAMGHIDWTVTVAFGLASVPLSAAGARIALRTGSARLELIYGAVLMVLGAGLLFLR